MSPAVESRLCAAPSAPENATVVQDAEQAQGFGGETD